MKRKGTVVISRTCGRKLRRRPLSLGSMSKRVVYQAPWQRKLRPPPHARVADERASIEELSARLGQGGEDCDECVRAIIARIERSLRGTSIAAKLRRRKFNVGGKTMRVDDHRGRMRAWEVAEGSDRGADSGHELSAAAIERILAASGLPIPPFEEEGCLQPGSSRLCGTELARAHAVVDVQVLAWFLSQRGTVTCSYNKEMRSHSEKFATRGEAFALLLFDELTDRAWGTNPVGRLAYLRQEISDFLIHVKCERIRRKVRSPEPGDARRSILEAFIADNLRDAYERIYDRPCGISRRSDQTVAGPFVAFAQAFFKEAGLGNSDTGSSRQPFPAGETIARALRPRNKTRT